MTSLARGLLVLGAAAFLIFGVGAFAWDQAVAQFPWTVGPLLAQTIGGWALGTGAIAAYAALRGLPQTMYPLLLYLGLFGAGQLLIVAAFASKLLTSGLLTYPYLLGLGSLAIGAAAWAVELRAGVGRPAAVETLPEATAPRWLRAFAVLLAGFVALLAIGTLIAGPDGATARGEVFPEPMGPFSIRAFSAFLFPLSVAIASVLWARDLRPFRALGWSGLFLIVPITLAALLHLDRFDASKPATLVYLWAYIVVGVIIVVVLAYERLRPQAFGVR